MLLSQKAGTAQMNSHLIAITIALYHNLIVLVGELSVDMRPPVLYAVGLLCWLCVPVDPGHLSLWLEQPS